MLKSTWQQIKTKEFKVLISIKSQSGKVVAMVKLNDSFWGFVDRANCSLPRVLLVLRLNCQLALLYVFGIAAPVNIKQGFRSAHPLAEIQLVGRKGVENT